MKAVKTRGDFTVAGMGVTPFLKVRLRCSDRAAQFWGEGQRGGLSCRLPTDARLTGLLLGTLLPASGSSQLFAARTRNSQYQLLSENENISLTNKEAKDIMKLSEIIVESRYL